MTEEAPKLCFKNPNFSFTHTGNKKLVWKSLKQIIATEKMLPWSDDAVTCNKRKRHIETFMFTFYIF